MFMLPDKKYSIIYADPPWSYRDSQKANGLGAVGHYPLMSTADICALPVADIAAADCMLFLWATWPCLEDALKVISAWGFDYKTIGFLWLKLNRNGTYSARGTGHYTKPNSEPCLIGRKGRRLVERYDISSIIQAKRGRHSAKPPIVRHKIVELCGDLPRIELFARPRDTLVDIDHMDGWDLWGNET